jgi:hypothetical protein
MSYMRETPQIGHSEGTLTQLQLFTQLSPHSPDDAAILSALVTIEG